MSEFRILWEPWETPTLTTEHLQQWEDAHALRLPAILREGLLEQNGGRVRETELSIDPLHDFSSLDEEQWEHAFAEEPLKNLDRSRLLHVGEAVGCGIVLDYTAAGEPRVLLLHHNLGGELRDEEVGSFEDLLRLVQAPPPEREYRSKRSKDS
jgi:hypothetical protein